MTVAAVAPEPDDNANLRPILLSLFKDGARRLRIGLRCVAADARFNAHSGKKI